MTVVDGTGVVVGIDGSAAADRALDWAATQAAADGRVLVLVAAATPPATDATGWLALHGIDHSGVRAQLKEGLRAMLRHADARVRETHPDLEIHHEARLADPRDALLDVAADADLLVVGSRGLGKVRRLFLGSVAAAVAKHAGCPTAVVRESRDGADGVLVGVAGDAGDAAVVDLAFRVAAARELPLTLFHSVWDVVGVDEGRDVAPDVPGYDDQWAVLHAAADSIAERYPDVEVRHRLSRGFADERLLNASRKAEVVVMGHQRQPLLTDLVYGSAAPHVLEGAPCSVVVVPYRVPGDD